MFSQTQPVSNGGTLHTPSPPSLLLQGEPSLPEVLGVGKTKARTFSSEGEGASASSG